MVTVTPSQRTKKARRKFLGITARAAALGVTRQHLYLVLTGRRVSPRVLNACRDLLKGARP